MNIAALSTIIETTERDLFSVLEIVEKRQNDQKAQEKIDKGEVDDPNIAHLREPAPVMTSEDKDRYYRVSEDDFCINILRDELALRDSDIEIFRNIFCLIDSTGVGWVNIQHVILSFVIITSTTIEHCLESSFRIVDRPKKTRLVEKSELTDMFKLINDALYFFGDKYLYTQQIYDLVDSIYTSAGLIDGAFPYQTFIPYMAGHPIVEMAVSMQFQGAVRSKLLSDEEVEKVVYFEKS